MLQKSLKPTIGLLAVFGLMLLLVGCSQKANLAYAEIAPAGINIGDGIPLPTGNAILNISGAISQTNDNDKLVLDIATLEKLGLVEYTIADPWQNHEEITYVGVLISDLLKYAGASDTATNVHMVALDEYAVDVSMEDVKKWPVLLATRTNGSYMDIESSGPTRVVFPFHSNPEIDEDTYKVLMIWNLRDIVIQ
ncbi:MAG: molybdopterin-dependent oxidoreductase [Chloroflexi bacterium]|nr:molybdopterin-dependent oxidoreductase [Chloroflexota bacterium]